MAPSESDRSAEAIVRRARSVLGTRFRPQGRCPREGLDCIGLAAFAAGVPRDALPADYVLRGGDAGRIGEELARCGFVPVAGGARPGDIGVYAPGPAQLHLAVLTGATLIHADAALRRIVERPLPAPWPPVGLWRLSED